MSTNPFLQKTAGFSLTQVLVALGFLGLLGAFVSSILTGGQKGQLAIRQRDEFREAMNLTQLVLATRTNCGLDVPTLAATSFAWASLPVTLPLAQIGTNNEVRAGQTLPSLHLSGLSLEVLGQIETGTRADAQIVVKADKLVASPGGAFFEQKIRVVLETIEDPATAGSRKISGCISIAADAVAPGGEESEMDPTEICSLLGRGYDAASNRCDPESPEYASTVTLNGTSPLAANQIPKFCLSTDSKNAPVNKACNAGFSQHRVSAPAPGTRTDIPELQRNTATTSAARNEKGACIYEGGQWYWGTLAIPKNTSPSATQLKPASDDKKRLTCTSVTAANVDPATPTIETLALAASPATKGFPGAFSDSVDWWKNAHKTGANQAAAKRITKCYKTNPPGTPVACSQEVGTNNANNWTSFKAGYCRYVGGKWEVKDAGGWPDCKGGVEIDPL